MQDIPESNDRFLRDEARRAFLERCVREPIPSDDLDHHMVRIAGSLNILHNKDCFPCSHVINYEQVTAQAITDMIRHGEVVLVADGFSVLFAPADSPFAATTAIPGL